MGPSIGEWRWPRWFALYAVAVVALTLTPFWPTCRPQAPVFALAPLDVAQNLLLFAPFGFALRGQPAALIVGLALLLSGSLELAQVRLPRTPNGADVAMNVLGAWLGSRIDGVTLPPAWRRTLGFAAALASCVAALIACAAASTAVPNDFRSWRDQPLRVDPGGPGSRWRGRLAELRIYDRAVAPSGVRFGAAPPGWRDGGPVLWWRADAPDTARADGPRGPRTVAVAAGRPWPDALARDLAARLVASGRMSIAARLHQASPGPSGRAPIVALARDEIDQDFTFEQHGAELALRVSTANDAVHPWQSELRTSGAAAGAERIDVVAAFHGPYARLFVDGRCAAEILYPLELRAWPFAGGIAATVLICTLGPAFAAAWAVARRARSGAAVVAVHALAGAAAWGALRGAGVWAHFPDFDATALAIAVAGWTAALPLVSAAARRPPG